MTNPPATKSWNGSTVPSPAAPTRAEFETSHAQPPARNGRIPDDAMEYRFNLSCKLDWATHTQLQDLANERGLGMSVIMRNAIISGLAALQQNDSAKISPALEVAVERRRMIARNELREQLARIAHLHYSDPKKFANLCKRNEFTVAEVLTLANELREEREFDAKRIKRDKCAIFLRVLLGENPDGQLIKDIQRKAEPFEFSDMLIYRSLKDIGAKNFKRGQESRWRL